LPWGVSLYGYGIRGQVRQALSLVSLKLFLMPAVALGMALAIGLPEFQAKIAVAAASLPAGVNSWLIASRLGTGQRLASTSMTIGTALAALTTGDLAGNRGGGAVRFSLVRGAGRCFTFVYFLLTFVMGSK
jgi:predicted permease